MSPASTAIALLLLHHIAGSEESAGDALLRETQICWENSPKLEAARKAVEDLAKASRTGKLEDIEAAWADERKMEDRFTEAFEDFLEARHDSGAVRVIAPRDCPLILVLGGTGKDEGHEVQLFMSRLAVLPIIVGGRQKQGSNGGFACLYLDGNRKVNNPQGRFSLTLEYNSHTDALAIAAGGIPAVRGTENSSHFDALSEDDIGRMRACVETLAAEWDSADKQLRLEQASLAARICRPFSGVRIFLTKAQDLMFVVGADGREADPDGVSIEIHGRPAKTVVVAPGNAAPGGAPGTCTGRDVALTVPVK